jgi:GNAT superfamily N-acetyltransferase
MSTAFRKREAVLFWWDAADIPSPLPRLAYLVGMDTSAIALRSATGRDLAGVDRMLGQSYPRLLKNDYAPSVMVTAVPLISRANPALLASGTYYVAELPDGQIVGAGGWTTLGGGAATAEIRHLVVDWRHQRRGIGRRLMMGIFAEAHLQGIRHFEARATRTAVRFYEAMGFDALGPLIVPLRPGIGFPAVMMRRFA